jgi:RNA polymerase sigma factor (sigma-70 family)
MSLMNSSLAMIEAVYRERGADFFRLALARTGDAEQARDAVQEGFAHAIRGRGSYRATGSLEAWVARCVVNAAHDAARTGTRSPVPVSEPPEVGNGRRDAAEIGPSGDPAAEIVREAVRRLPQRQRDALFLRHYLDFDYAAIAEALGIEVGTVSATLHIARAALAADLQEVAR